MNLRNLPIAVAGLIVVISILLVVVGDGDFGSVTEQGYLTDKSIFDSP